VYLLILWASRVEILPVNRIEGRFLQGRKTAIVRSTTKLCN
jgi:hypothetical protein